MKFDEIIFGFAVNLVVGIICGFYMGFSFGADSTKQEAVKNHHAYFNPINKEFTWGDNLPTNIINK